MKKPKFVLEVTTVGYRKSTMYAYIALLISLLSGVALLILPTPSEFSLYLFAFFTVASGVACTRSEPLIVINKRKIDLTPMIEAVSAEQKKMEGTGEE